MITRRLFLAAAAVLGLGSGAQAATLTSERYDLRLRYEGTVFSQVALDLPSGEHVFLDRVGLGENIYGIPSTFFPSLSIGDLIDFRAVAYFSDPPVYGEGPGYYSNGGSAPVCQFGPVACTDTNSTWKDNGGGIAFNSEDQKQITGGTTIGSSLNYYFWTSDIYSGSGTFPDGRYLSFWSEEASFTVVEVLQPAPVPLPAGAALLPVALAGLGMMRGRRKAFTSSGAGAKHAH